MVDIDVMHELIDTRYGKFFIFSNDTGGVTECLRVFGEWGQNELAFIAQFISDGDLIVDAGAYIGTHCYGFSQMVGETGHVISIEAQDKTFVVLRKNITLHKLKQAQLINAALTDHVGEYQIPEIDITVKNSFGGASLKGFLTDDNIDRSPWSYRPDGNLHTLKLISIDSLKLSECRFIKIDVEGMEAAVIKGADETIKKFSPVIFAECNSAHDGLKTYSVLKDYGYQIFAHVCRSFNDNNFNKINHDIVHGNGVEVSILAVKQQNDLDIINNYQPKSHEIILPIEIEDDLFLALLNKPQYPADILVSGAAAKAGGMEFFKKIEHDKIEINHLNEKVSSLTLENDHLRAHSASLDMDNQAKITQLQAEVIQLQTVQKLLQKKSNKLDSILSTFSWLIIKPFYSIEREIRKTFK